MRAGNATINTARLTRPERFDFVAVTDVPRRPRLRSTCERPEKKRKKIEHRKNSNDNRFQNGSVSKSFPSCRRDKKSDNIMPTDQKETRPSSPPPYRSKPSRKRNFARSRAGPGWGEGGEVFFLPGREKYLQHSKNRNSIYQTARRGLRLAIRTGGGCVNSMRGARACTAVYI